jgi:hypothetical protein
VWLLWVLHGGRHEAPRCCCLRLKEPHCTAWGADASSPLILSNAQVSLAAACQRFVSAMLCVSAALGMLGLKLQLIPSVVVCVVVVWIRVDTLAHCRWGIGISSMHSVVVCDA